LYEWCNPTLNLLTQVHERTLRVLRVEFWILDLLVVYAALET